MPGGDLENAIAMFEAKIDETIKKGRDAKFENVVIPDATMAARLRANADQLDAGTWSPNGGTE